MASTAILIDVVLDDAEEGKIACHGHESDEPGDCRHHGSEDCAAEACTECHEKGDECETAGDGVEDHDSSQGLCGIGRCRVEGCVVDASHDISGIVADVLASA